MATDTPDVDTSEIFGNGPDPEGDFLTAGTTRDDVYEMLSAERRRIVLKYLVENDEGKGVSIGDLAEAVEYVQGDYEDIDAISCGDRKRVYVTLLQCHLPKLDGAGIIEADERTNHAYATAATEAAVDVTEEIEDRLVDGDDRTNRSFLSGIIETLNGVIGAIEDRLVGDER